MKKKVALKSVEDASVIRKFSVVFSFISLLPFGILTFIFYIIVSSKGKGQQLQIDDNFLFWTVFIAGAFSIIGFIMMRKTFVYLIKVAKDAQAIIKGNLSKRIDVAADGDNEVTQVATAFNEILRQLESNISELESLKKTLK